MGAKGPQPVLQKHSLAAGLGHAGRAADNSGLASLRQPNRAFMVL
jgi:hypothetical protein